MDLLDFVATVSRRLDEPSVARWADYMQETLTSQTLHLARYVDALPEDLRERYRAIVRQLLDALPEQETVRVAPSVLSHLKALLPDDGQYLDSKLALPA